MSPRAPKKRANIHKNLVLQDDNGKTYEKSCDFTANRASASPLLSSYPDSTRVQAQY